MVLIRTRIFGGSQNTVYLSYEILEKSQSKGFKLDTIYETLEKSQSKRTRSTISFFYLFIKCKKKIYNILISLQGRGVKSPEYSGL
jgi:uncharacterized protein YaaN involved in tellurite resistance